MADQNKPATAVKVTVVFPLGIKPFHAEVAPTAIVGTVLSEAMTFFGVKADGQTVYYLTHKGQRQAGDVKIGDLAGHAHAVEFNMAKELIQGA